MLIKKRICFISVLMFSASVTFGQINFREEEVVFRNGNLKLAGTLFLPITDHKVPAIAVTHGSGKDSRKQEGYRSLASTLAAEGYAVLIYDKRGVGNSDGEYIETPDISVPTGDLIAAVSVLKSRKEIDLKRIGVYGHSQGGWVAPLAAIILKDISYVIVSCGGGISMREQVLYNTKTSLLGNGIDAVIADSVVDFGRELYSYLATGIGYNKLNPYYERASMRKWFEVFSSMGFTKQLPPPSMLREPIFHFFKAIHYDPQSTLRALDIPTLVMLAEKDNIVPSQKSKALWQEAFYSGQREKLLSIVELKGENHYDFELVNNSVRYKKSFSDPMIAWLSKTISSKN